MALKDRILKMETVLKVSAPSGGPTWWEPLLRAPKENETALNAAFLMALNGIIPQPVPSLWPILEERFKGDVEAWPLERTWFAAAYCEPDHEGFTTPEGKNALCYLALAYWNTFHALPLGEGEKKVAFNRLHDCFISPLFWRLHDIHRLSDWRTPAWSFAAFTGWLKCEQVVEIDDLFQSLLDWIGGRK